MSTKAAQNQTLSCRHQLVSLAAAAGAVDVHPRTVRRWIAAGALTGYRVGPRMVKVDLDELEAFIRPIPTAAGDAA